MLKTKCLKNTEHVTETVIKSDAGTTYRFNE